MTPLELIGLSALVAAVATVVGAVFLGLFFWKGGIWGLLNDVASIVLMVATIPVALFLASHTGEYIGPVVAGGVALVGIVGMVGASVSQGLLIARIRTYQELLPWTLGFGAIVGVWYIGIGLTGLRASIGEPMAALALLSGVSFISLGYGFWRGNERHPLSVAGGVVLLVASTLFLVWISYVAPFALRSYA
jgi:hypothetical protein